MPHALDRLRRMTRQELTWRAASAARIAAQRIEVRVRQPRWDRTRLHHALTPDVASGEVGTALAARDWNAAHAALRAQMRARQPRFVLDPRSAPSLRDAISSRRPSAPAEAAERADRILRGEYDLLGYRGLSLASSDGAPDWHRDAVHGRTAPRAFWADVEYLDPATGDHKVIWELNRHQHWLQLGRALWLTGDSRYGHGIVDLLDGWLAANPPLTGINWASMLEIGFRTMSWTWALHFLLGHRDHGEISHRDHQDHHGLGDLRVLSGSNHGDLSGDGPWLIDMLLALDRQLVHVEQNLSYYFSPNTHLTGEALALYVVGAALPELRRSSRWMDVGRRVLVTEIERQIHGDGGHAERSTHYQRYTLDFYLLALLTARRIGDADAAARFTEAATRLARFTRAMADDGGVLPLIGDDDGGMLWPMTGRACNDVRDSLAIAAVVLNEPDLSPWERAEEVLWLTGTVAPSHRTLAPSHPRTLVPSHLSQTFAETGYVVLRDERGGHAVFDTGRHGYLNGGHAHADALALTLTLEGRPLLIDPGTSTYTMNPELRNRLRSTMSHNTITVDERSQSEPLGPFHWRTRADAVLRGSRHNWSFDWAEGFHDGYAPIAHRRAVLRTAQAGWLIVDDISGEGHHVVDARWHFDPAWMIGCDVPGRLRATHLDRGIAWLLHDGCNVGLMLGDDATGIGWHAPVYGTLVPTWTARVTRQGVLPIRMVTWIGAAASADAAPPALERFVPECDDLAHAIGARVTAGPQTSTFVLLLNEPDARDGRAMGTPEFQTDARVLHYTEHQGCLATLDLVDVSHALALRDGWLSVTSTEPLPDLHVGIDGPVLDVRTSDLRGQLRIDGEALKNVELVLLNGREVRQPTSLSTTPSQVTPRAASNPASPSAAASFLFSPSR